MNFDPGTAVWSMMLIGTSISLLMLIPDFVSVGVNAARRRSARRSRAIRTYR